MTIHLLHSVNERIRYVSRQAWGVGRDLCIQIADAWCCTAETQPYRAIVLNNNKKTGRTQNNQVKKGSNLLPSKYHLCKQNKSYIYIYNQIFKCRFEEYMLISE